MKLQPASRKELTHIACGTTLCTVAMWVVFAALHLVGAAPFDYRVVWGGVVGAAIATGNFALLCLTVQQGIETEDEKKRKTLFQLSYNGRTLLQAVWLLVAWRAPCFQTVAGALPLLFPRVTIYYLQITGRYKPEPKKGGGQAEEDADATADAEPEAADPLPAAPASGDEGGEK